MGGLFQQQQNPFNDPPPPALQALAQKQMQLAGVTAQQAQAYRPGLSQALYNSVDPTQDYDQLGKSLAALAGAALGKTPKYERASTSRDHRPSSELPESDDAWAMYLGLPQKHGSFDVSQYTPSQTKGKGDKVYYKLTRDILSEWDKPTFIKSMVAQIDRSPSGRALGAHAPLQYFQWSKGKDEKGPYLAYYDIWDLKPNMLEAGRPIPKMVKQLTGADATIGKPFEVYDRIYYDPKTFEPIADKKTKK